jgi:hypothetical protein
MFVHQDTAEAGSFLGPAGRLNGCHVMIPYWMEYWAEWSAAYPAMTYSSRTIRRKQSKMTNVGAMACIAFTGGMCYRFC